MASVAPSVAPSVDSYFYIDWNVFEVKSVDSMDDDKFIQTQKVIRVLDCYKDLTADGGLPRDIEGVKFDKYKLALILGYDNDIATKAGNYQLKDIEDRINQYFADKGLIEVQTTDDVKANKKGVEIAFEESGKNPESYLKDINDDRSDLKISRSFANILDTGPSSGKTVRDGTYYEFFEEVGITLCLTEQLKNFGFDNCSLDVKYISKSEIDFCLTIDGEIMVTMKNLNTYAIGNQSKNSWIRKMIAKEHIDKLIDSNSTKNQILNVLRVLFKIKAMGDTLQVIMLNEIIRKRDFKNYFMVTADNVVHSSLMLIYKNSIYKHDKTLEIFTVPALQTIDEATSSFIKSFERMKKSNDMKIQKLSNAYNNKNNRGTQFSKPNGTRLQKDELRKLLDNIENHIEALKDMYDLVLQYVGQITTNDPDLIELIRNSKVLIKNMNILDKLQIKEKKIRNHYTLVGITEFTELIVAFNELYSGFDINGGSRTKNRNKRNENTGIKKNSGKIKQKRSGKNIRGDTNTLDMKTRFIKQQPTKLRILVEPIMKPSIEPFTEEYERLRVEPEWMKALYEIHSLYNNAVKIDGTKIDDQEIDNQIVIQAFKLFNMLFNYEAKPLFAAASIIEENSNNNEQSYVQLDTQKEMERLTDLLGKFKTDFSLLTKKFGGSSKNCKKRQTKRKPNFKRKTQTKKHSFKSQKK